MWMFQKNKIAEERGEVMLEASIIMVSVLILLMALLSITFLFYQQAVMTTVATEIAQDVAKNFKFTDLEIGSNELSTDHYEGTKMFRTNFGLGGLEDIKNDLADEYAEERLRLSSFGLNAGDFTADVQLKVIGIGRILAIVTVSQPSEFFLSGILDMTGIAAKETLFSATAYAECVDMMGYSATINLTDYATAVFSPLEFVGDFYGSIKDFAQTLMGN